MRRQTWLGEIGCDLTKVFRALAWAIGMMIGAAAVCSAQSYNNSNVGLPPNGVFSGTEFENVQLNNGNLHIKIPIWSAKGRGLSTGFKYVYDTLSLGFPGTKGRLSKGIQRKRPS